MLKIWIWNEIILYFKRVFELTVKDNTHFLHLPSFFLPLKISTSLWVSELDLCLLLSWSALSYIKHVSHGDKQTTTILFPAVPALPAHKHYLDPEFKLNTMRHMELTYYSCWNFFMQYRLQRHTSWGVWIFVYTRTAHSLLFSNYYNYCGSYTSIQAPGLLFFYIKLCKFVVQLGTGCNMQYYINYDLSIFTCTDKLKIFILCMIFCCCCQSCHYYDLLKSVITSLRW